MAEMASPIPATTHDTVTNGGLAELENEFPLLGQEGDPESRAAHDAAVRQGMSSPMVDTDGAAEDDDMPQPEPEPEPARPTTSGEEDNGYPADADEQLTSEAAAQPKKRREKSVEAKLDARRRWVSGRYETRGASKRSLRSSVKSQIKPTTKAASLRKKAKRKPVASRRVMEGAALGSSGGRRSGRVDGKSGDDDDERKTAYVLVSRSEADMEGVEKHW